MTDNQPTPPPKGVPSNAIQLPSVPVQPIPKSQHFKSSSNLVKDHMARQVSITNRGTFMIEPNTSIYATIDFKHEFGSDPLIFYTLICKDGDFNLCNYINSLSNKQAVIAIENTCDKQREVSIIYKVTSN